MGLFDDLTGNWRRWTAEGTQAREAETLRILNAAAGRGALDKQALDNLIADVVRPGGLSGWLMRLGVSFQLAAGTLGQLVDVASRGARYSLERLYLNALPDVGAIIGLAVRHIVPPDRAAAAVESQGIGPYWRDALARASEATLTQDQVVDAARRGLLDGQRVADALDRLGFSDEQRGTLLALGQRLPDVAAVLDAWLRGERTEVQTDASLAALGLSPNDANLYKRLSLQQPTLSDLVRFLVRDVYDPTMRRALNLDAEYPGAGAEQQARRIGASPELLRDYWAAHWELPSPEQGFAMFQRGIIDQAELERLLRALDYAPIWRDKLLRLNYRVLTRVDVRRMYESGVLSKAEVAAAYREGGYSPANADRLADFVEAQALGKASTKQGKAKDLTAPVIREAYRDALIDQAAATDALVALGYDQDEAGYLLALDDYRVSRETRGQYESAVRALYVRGQYTFEQAAQLLADAGAPAARQERLLAAWQLERTSRELTAEEKADRDLTKAEVISAYRDYLLKREDAAPMLTTLGYAAEEADLLLRQAEHARLKAERSSAQAAIRTLYVAHRIDEREALQRMDALQVPSLQRDALMLQWTAEQAAKDAEKRRDAPAIPLGSVEQMVRRSVMTADEARSYLQTQGWTPAELDWIMRLWGAKTRASSTNASTTGAR